MSMSRELPKSLLLTIIFACAIGGAFVAHGCKRTSPVTASPAEATIEGVASVCWQGKIVPTNGMPVRIYTMEQSKEIRDLLERWGTLPKDNSPTTLQQISSVMDQLEQALRETSTFLPPVKTDRDGRFWFHHVPAGPSYFVVAADLDSEEGPDFLTHQITHLKPGIERISLIYGADSAKDCKTPAKN